jgi:hypothetical protein
MRISVSIGNFIRFTAQELSLKIFSLKKIINVKPVFGFANMFLLFCSQFRNPLLLTAQK